MAIINTGGGAFGAVAGAKKPILFSINLVQTNWAESGDDSTILSQTVNNSNFIASNYSYLVSPSQDNYNEYVDGSVRAFDVTRDGEITFVCLGEKKPGNIQVDILRIEEEDNG